MKVNRKAPRGSVQFSLAQVLLLLLPGCEWHRFAALLNKFELHFTQKKKNGQTEEHNNNNESLTNGQTKAKPAEQIIYRFVLAPPWKATLGHGVAVVNLVAWMLSSSCRQRCYWATSFPSAPHPKFNCSYYSISISISICRKLSPRGPNCFLSSKLVNKFVIKCFAVSTTEFN